MSKQYSVDFRWAGGPVDVRKSEFDRLRGHARIFEVRSKGMRLRIRSQYFAWRNAEGEVQFQEKDSGRIIGRYIPSPEDSAARVERLCSAQDPRYIRDDRLRQLEIQRDYA